MFFGSDWLANIYMGCFLFGLIFTSLSLFLNLSHLSFGDSGAGDGAGHDLGALGHDASGASIHAGDLGAHAAPGVHIHPGDLGGHDGSGLHVHPGDLSGHDAGDLTGHHAGGTNGHAASADQGIEGLSPMNLPTLLAFVTWFGGAGYIFRVTLGWDVLVTGLLAVVSGVVGGALVFWVLSYLLIRGQTPPMRRADYYLPGTRARVISGIAAGGTGEIVFVKGGVRRVEGARSETDVAIPRETEVVIQRYEDGLAYVEPVTTAADLPPPEVARVEGTREDETRSLAGSGPALTRDLGKDS